LLRELSLWPGGFYSIGGGALDSSEHLIGQTMSRGGDVIKICDPF